MRQKTFSWLLATLLVLTGVVYGNPEMRVNMKAIEFGYVGVDYNLYQEVEVHNTGSSELKITEVSPSCDCSRTSVEDTIIAPGQKTKIRLKFNTKNWYGDTDQYFTVISNDPALPEIQIPYHSYVGKWVKGIMPNPKALFFLPGKSQGEITIPNTEHDQLVAKILDQSDSWFRVALIENKVGLGENILIRVIADDSLIKGTYEGSFRVEVTGEGRDEPVILSIPVKIVKY